MPTGKPRDAITDTASVARTLDEAALRQPELAGARTPVAEPAASASDERLRLTRRLPDLVDADALLADEAWR